MVVGMSAARSLLFVPATSARKVEKALTGAADAVIVDLEDAVALAEKAQARADAAGLLATRRGKTVYVRVNALGTAFCYADLLMAAAAPQSTGSCCRRSRRRRIC